MVFSCDAYLTLKAPQSCKAVVFRGGMSAVVAGTERFYDNFSIQIAGLSLLSVAFAGGWWVWLLSVLVTGCYSTEPEGRLKFLTEHARSVDWVITSMKLYGQNIALMEGSCAFFALLMVGGEQQSYLNPLSSHLGFACV